MLLAGDKSLSYYAITKDIPCLTVGLNKVYPSTLLVFRKTKHRKEMFGISNGEIWNLPESNDNSIHIIFDRSNRNKLKLLTIHGTSQFTYPEKDDVDDTEKLIILQKNPFFCETILYDPTVSKNLLFIPYGNKALSYPELDLFVISYIRTHFPEELKSITTGELFKWGI